MKCSSCGIDKDLKDFLVKGKVCLECNRAYMQKWREAKKNDPEWVLKEQNKQKEWWAKNREKGNERQKNYRKDNDSFRISNALRARVKYALLGCVRHDKTFDLLGCSPKEWKEYLESKFTEGMNWDNYGSFWEVDHIVPVSHFDLTDTEEQKKAFHYLNTQPLNSIENRKKGNRWVG